MKFKSLFFTAIASVAALLASCTSQEELIEPKMATDSATYKIGADGGDVTVKLLAGQDWTATVEPGTSLDEVSDVTVTPDHGVASSVAVEVKVTLGENSSFNRKARVSFQGKTLSAAVVIEQEGKAGERLLKCSVSEFLQKPVDASVYYELTGIVGTITHEEYSNFYIVDPVTKESILIYGLAYKEDVSNQKVSLLVKEGVKEGDTITIASTRSDYNGTPQGKNSYYISHEKSQNPMIKLGLSEIVAVAGTSFDLAVTSNLVTWTLSSDVKWLSFEPSTGSESTVVVVSVAEEKEGDVNEATITLSAEGLESVTCAVTRTNIQDATAAEVNAAEDGKVFRVTGVVSSIVNEQYGNLYIKDYTGEVYVYGTNNFAEEGIAAGDVITVVGSKSSYKEAPQMKNVDVEKHYSIKDTPVADFRAAEDNREVYYRLTGKVIRSTEEGTKFDLEEYGNFAIEDETGNVYVYGVRPGWGSPKGQFGSLEVKEGDTITIIAYKTSYKGLIEADGCVYISHEPGEAPAPEYSLDGKQWEFKWEDMMNTSAVFDFGVTTPGVLYFAYDVSGANPDFQVQGHFYMYSGTYEIDAENSKVICNLVSAFDESEVLSGEIPYANLTESSVTFSFQNDFYSFIYQETAEATVPAEYIPILDFNSLGGYYDLIPSGEYWIVANGKAALPLSTEYGYPSVVDLVDDASFARNRFTITQYSEEDPTYTIQDAEGYYYYNQEGFKTLSRSLTFDEYSENAASFVWTIVEAKEGGYQISNNGTGATLAYSITHNSFGVYNDLADTVLPDLILSTYWELEPAAINVPAAKTVTEGETVALSPSTNSDATAFTYESADATIATVSAEGVITGVKEGTTTITVSIPATEYYTEASAEVTVTVKAVGGEVTTVDDVLNQDWTGVKETSYTLVEDLNGDSGAVYSVQCAGGNSSIQLRSKSGSGIVTTVSGGKAVKVVVEWEGNTVEGRTLDVYGSNTAYTNPTELYSNDTRGTKLGSIVCGTSTELELAGEYDYIAFRSNDGAMYIKSITITYQK